MMYLIAIFLLALILWLIMVIRLLSLSGVARKYQKGYRRQMKKAAKQRRRVKK